MQRYKVYFIWKILYMSRVVLSPIIRSANNCIYRGFSTLTEGFSCVFLSCKANARVKPAKTGHGPHSSYFLCSMYFCVVLSIVCFVSLSVLFVCICVLNYCHRVATQLQLNISYIIYYIIHAYHVIYHIWYLSDRYCYLPL